MATKLKNLNLTSVDLVRAGANQEADICLYKSAEPQEEGNIFKRFIDRLRKTPDETHDDTIEKDYSTFDQINDNRDVEERLWRYTDALNCSIRSIRDDHDLSQEQKAEMMKKSLQQFSAAMEDLIGKLANTAPQRDEAVMAKSAPEFEEIEEIDTKKA